MNMYQLALIEFIVEIETKNSWGKNELKALLLNCLVKADDLDNFLKQLMKTTDNISDIVEKDQKGE